MKHPNINFFECYCDTLSELLNRLSEFLFFYNDKIVEIDAVNISQQEIFWRGSIYFYLAENFTKGDL